MSRVAERGEYPEAVRLRLLEGDLDEQDNELAAIRVQLNKLLWAVMGLLITLSTASVLLGINLAAMGS